MREEVLRLGSTRGGIRPCKVITTTNQSHIRRTSVLRAKGRTLIIWTASTTAHKQPANYNSQVPSVALMYANWMPLAFTVDQLIVLW